MMLKGIPVDVQRLIVKAFIYELNEVFKELAMIFDQVYHIDARGTAEKDDDWFDELHLKEYRFFDVAKAYDYCISSPGLKDKIIKVTDIRDGKIPYQWPIY